MIIAQSPPVRSRFFYLALVPCPRAVMTGNGNAHKRGLKGTTGSRTKQILRMLKRLLTWASVRRMESRTSLWLTMPLQGII